MIIGISGKMGAGKDTLANILVDLYPQLVVHKFAQPIRDEMRKRFGLNSEDLEFRKNTMRVEGKLIREHMQTIGDKYRAIDKNFFVLAMISRRSHYIVISDVRFNNEAEWIRKEGGIIINIERDNPNAILTEHVSEDGLDEHYIDYKIDNNGSISALRVSAREIYEHYHM